jgi:hypothetical protein
MRQAAFYGPTRRCPDCNVRKGQYHSLSCPQQLHVDLEQFFDPDAPPGEAIHRQVKDPDDGTVYAPGLKVTEDGEVTFFN